MHTNVHAHASVSSSSETSDTLTFSETGRRWLVSPDRG